MHAVFDEVCSAVNLGDEADLRNLGALGWLMDPEQRISCCLDLVGELHQGEGVGRRPTHHEVHLISEFSETPGLAAQ